MAQDALMATAVRLSTSLEALAALAGHIRLESEPLESDPSIRSILGEVAEELLGEGSILDGRASAPVVGMTRAFLQQATELVANPGRSGSWHQVDEVLLQGIGRLSGAVVQAVQAAEGHLDGLSPCLDAPGGTFLDVGTGTGWLAMALARAYPSLQVIGIDVFEPALELARRNVTREGLAERVQLRLQDVVTLDADAHYDVIWLPLPFLPLNVVQLALAASLHALRPGGWVLPGTFAGPGDRLSQLLIDLRTVRSGGHPWRADELTSAMAGAGFAEVSVVPRTWAAPVELYAGRRPS
jgi:SAM-dependent methyltransferase